MGVSLARGALKVKKVMFSKQDLVLTRKPDVLKCCLGSTKLWVAMIAKPVNESCKNRKASGIDTIIH